MCVGPTNVVVVGKINRSSSSSSSSRWVPVEGEIINVYDVFEI